ncbi:hypothetical protein [Pallidibacillus pasinlerensis]|uniref:hypothetical protein n=1 Tax=Pallidibacillus pasinlerensis TaxID=2703818 RepID=UPI00137944DC|nr:hypothetical protein [Pallidibacillus pasinlerensis]
MERGTRPRVSNEEWNEGPVPVYPRVSQQWLAIVYIVQSFFVRDYVKKEANGFKNKVQLY